MNEYEDIYSSLDAPGFDPSILDVVAIVRNSPRESVFNPYNIMDAAVISPSKFKFNLEQAPKLDTRHAGEGAESNTFAIGNVSILSSLSMPLQMPAIGYTDPAFALLWDYCRLAYWGTASVIKGRLTVGCNQGDSVLTISNISDFMPFVGTAKIVENNIEEVIVIESVDKTARQITLVTPIGAVYTTDAQIIAYLPRSAEVEREPCFSLLSLREGLIAPCLVNKIVLDISAGKEVTISVDIVSANIDRSKQLEFKSVASDLLKKHIAIYGISQFMNGTMAKISSISNNDGVFGLESVLGDNLFSGNQSLDLPLNLITGFTITIDNGLKNIYCLHSLEDDNTKRRRENSFPYAIYSEGRKITGSINYRHPANPFVFAERLSGPAGLGNGGLVITLDTFKLSIPEIVWSPSTSNSDIGEYQERTLDWIMGAQHYNSMPIIESV